MILLSFPNDGFISFTKLQEFLVAVTYKLGSGSFRWTKATLFYDIFQSQKSKIRDMGYFRDGPISLSMK